jgi:redox-sensitive bicupin YhaK (pirin superfamily)
MTNIDLIIKERAADIGDFMVGRLLPFRQKRMVGPFIFLDHMGPAQLTGSENLDVLPHPHTGLSTLTYLFEGALMHRDSLGSVQEIKPGAVNWMTAGKGVVHSERTPENLRGKEKTFHGLQIWVALPKNLEQTEPSFTHVSAEEIPVWKQDGLKMKLIAGEAFGKKSPVPVLSPLYLIEIKSQEETELKMGSQLYGESALYILEGSIKTEGNEYEPNQLLVARESSMCTFTLGAKSTVYLLGGAPFPEERFIYWNFVSSEKQLIEKAKKDWEEQKFPAIPGETGFVPLPKK